MKADHFMINVIDLELRAKLSAVSEYFSYGNTEDKNDCYLTGNYK